MFLTLVKARFQYELPAIDGFMSMDDITRINAVFVMARKWSLITIALNDSDLIKKDYKKLFKTALHIACIHYCLKSGISLVETLEGEAILCVVLNSNHFT